MATTKLTVGTKANAGFGDFVPVSMIVDGVEYGCDAHLGTGKTTEQGAVVSRELIDWNDGNGLLSHGLATGKEVWTAIDPDAERERAK